MVRGIWAVTALLAQVHSWLEAEAARNCARSSFHRCIRKMSIWQGGRSRTARHELLQTVPNTDSAAPLVRARSMLISTLRGSAPSHRSAGTCVTKANTTDLSHVVAFAVEALHRDTTIEEVVSSIWPKDCAADDADVFGAAAADIATAAAAAVIGAAVVYDAMGAVGAAAALDASVVDDPAAACDLDHRRGV